MKVAIGQDSHRIDYTNTDKKLILGGVEFKEVVMEMLFYMLLQMLFQESHVKI